jgi:hypothetical protein
MEGRSWSWGFHVLPISEEYLSPYWCVQEQNEAPSNFSESVLEEILVDGSLQAVLENASTVGVMETLLDR